MLVIKTLLLLLLEVFGLLLRTLFHWFFDGWFVSFMTMLLSNSNLKISILIRVHFFLLLLHFVIVTPIPEVCALLINALR